MRPWFAVPSRVVANTPVDASMRHLVVHAPAIAAAARPGQFVALRVPGGAGLLPRPFDLHAADPASGDVEVVFRVKGRGTQALASAVAGGELEVQGPFGRPLDGALERVRRIAVIGRGAGLSPLTFLAGRARDLGVEVAAYLSARTPALLGPFAGLREAATAHVHTDLEQPGALVTDALAADLEARPIDAAFVVGSRRLALATLELARRHHYAAYTFAECHMGCGFGHCKSCAVPTRQGYLLACLDGPVVDLEEVSDAYWDVLPG